MSAKFSCLHKNLEYWHWGASKHNDTLWWQLITRHCKTNWRSWKTHVMRWTFCATNTERSVVASRRSWNDCVRYRWLRSWRCCDRRNRSLICSCVGLALHKLWSKKFSPSSSTSSSPLSLRTLWRYGALFIISIIMTRVVDFSIALPGFSAIFCWRAQLVVSNFLRLFVILRGYYMKVWGSWTILIITIIITAFV